MRTGSTFVRSGSNVYAVGGLDDKARLVNVVESLDLTTGAFTTLATWPTPRYTEIAVDAGGRICFGYGTINLDELVDVIDCYDTEKNTWSTLPPLPVNLDATVQSMTSHGRDIYVFGAEDAMKSPQGVYVHEDGQGAWKELSPIPDVCLLNYPVTVGDKIYLFDCGVNTDQKLLLAYDIPTATWSTLAPPPPGNIDLVSRERPEVHANGFVFINRLTKEVWHYDIAANQWSKSPTLPIAVANSATALVDNKLFVRVLQVAAGVGTGAIHVYDLATQTWSIGLDLPEEKGLILHAEVVGSEIHYLGEQSTLAPSIGF